MAAGMIYSAKLQEIIFHSHFNLGSLTNMNGGQRCKDSNNVVFIRLNMTELRPLCRNSITVYRLL